LKNSSDQLKYKIYRRNLSLLTLKDPIKTVEFEGFNISKITTSLLLPNAILTISKMTGLAGTGNFFK